MRRGGLNPFNLANSQSDFEFARLIRKFLVYSGQEAYPKPGGVQVISLPEMVREVASLN